MSITFENAATKSVDVNGTNFVYREIGRTGGIPVVLLHHLTAVLEDWDPRIVDGLAAKHHVIAFDNRGVGGSGGSTPKTVDPVLVVNGDDDVMVPSFNSFELARRLPNAQLSIFPDAGHGGIFQHHATFVQQALAFLES